MTLLRPHRLATCFACLLLVGRVALGQPADNGEPVHKLDPTKKLEFFPVTTQFSPVPSGEGWNGREGALSVEEIHQTIDNIRAHGFTGLEMPTHRPAAEEAEILAYAQSCGMIVTYHLGALERFGREAPPNICVYSPKYAEVVRKDAQRRLAALRSIPRLYNVLPFQDEPFHWGPLSFGYNDEVRAEFLRRYGYELPPDLASIRNDPRRWLDVINFRSDYFPDGWRQVYKILKELDPTLKTALTHDSHNTLGGGCGSHTELAIDDVFHWGGDFADMFLFDLYPYLSSDYRFGQPARLRKPRMSQTHYCFAQMRNLTRAYGKELGFWVGTYNPAWFPKAIKPELQAKHWTEREMSATAVAQGADFLLTGYKIPVDPGHWESFGEGLRLIQKAGGRLLGMPKVQARACMLFPRTQLLQVQEEYFNVALSYELFLRAFGELDILHEEQVTDDRLDGYEVLVLFDVSLLPEPVARRIASFVEGGGLVIADCVPREDALRQPLEVMEQLFGVKEAKTDRIRRPGNRPPRQGGPAWDNRPATPPDETAFATDTVQGTVLGQPLDLELISPRPAKATTGEVLLTTAAGQPAIVHRRVGRGNAYLLGWCLQDTYFHTWQNEQPAARDQLAGLLRAITASAGVRPHVSSSNPEIEASLRANATEAFLFVINHEASHAETLVCLADLGFPIETIRDLADGQPVPMEAQNGAVCLKLSVPIGQTRLFEVTSQNRVALQTKSLSEDRLPVIP